MCQDVVSIVKNLASVEIVNPMLWSEISPTIRGVVIVGSTCSGKSTLVDAIRESSLDVVVPKRVITRPQRQKDNVIENTFRSKEELNNMVKSREIGLHWTRKMEGSREEKYGFLAADPSKFIIYSGNNALYNNKDSARPTSIFKDHLYVGIYAPDDLRQKRLLDRSPDMSEAEMLYRLNDSSENILPHCHLIVKNFDEFECQSRDDLLILIENLQTQGL